MLQRRWVCRQKNVHLEYSTNKGNTWSGIADVLTGSPYSYTWSPNVGTYLIRARWDGDDDYGGDTIPRLHY